MTRATTFSAFFYILFIASQMNSNAQLLGNNLQQSCECHDVMPADDFSCAQQVAWGKCMKDWMISEGFCYKSCGFCTCQGGCTCMDIPPDSLYTCTQQKHFGKCDADWMVIGDFCQFTCGRCICQQQQQQQQQQLPQIYFNNEDTLPYQQQVSQSYFIKEDLESVPENFDDEAQILPAPEEEGEGEGSQSVILTNSDYALLEGTQQQNDQVDQENYLINEMASLGDSTSAALPPQVEQLIQGALITSSYQLDECISLADEVSQIEDLQTMGGFLRAADIQQQLNESSECTLFLPSNEAFDQFLSFLHLSAAELIVATAVLQAYLQYHIIPDTAYSQQDLSQTPKIYTLLPDSPPLQTQPHPNNSNILKIISPAIEAEIIQSDIQLKNNCFSNCMFHKINRVLSPVPFVSKNAPQQQSQYLVQQVAQTQTLQQQNLQEYQNQQQQNQFSTQQYSYIQQPQQQQNLSSSIQNSLNWQSQQNIQSTQFQDQQQQSYLQQQQNLPQISQQQQLQQNQQYPTQISYITPTLSATPTSTPTPNQGVLNLYYQNSAYNPQQQQQFQDALQQQQMLQKQLAEQLQYSIDVRQGESQPYFRTSEFAYLSDLQNTQSEYQVDGDNYDSQGERCDEWVGGGGRLDLLRGVGEQVDGLMQLMYSSTFVEFVEGVEEDLTILVPTNAAFEQLANVLGLNGIEGLMQLDYQILRELMATHLVSTKLGQQDLQQVENFTSTAGATISLQRLNGYSQNQQILQLTAPGSVARIVGATAGVSCDTWIHLIDNVLIPYPESIGGMKDRISQTQQGFLAASVFNPNLVALQDPPQQANTPFLIPMQNFIPPPPPLTPPHNSQSIKYQIELWKNLHVKFPPITGPSQISPEIEINWNKFENQNSNKSQFEEDLIQVEQQLQLQNLQLNECDSIMTILREREDLQFMAHALQDAEMGELFDNENSSFFTVFAVQNDFFRKMIFEMDDQIANLLSKNKQMQQALMGYMIVEGMYTANDLSNKNLKYLNTLTYNFKNNSQLKLFVESMGAENTIVLTGMEQNAVVIERDIHACNGIIHVISHGLSPVQIDLTNDEKSNGQFASPTMYEQTSFSTNQNVQNIQNVPFQYANVPLDAQNVPKTRQNLFSLSFLQSNVSSNIQVVPTLQEHAPQNMPIQQHSTQQTKCCKLINLLENIPAISWFTVLVRETGWGTNLVQNEQNKFQFFVPLNEAFGTLDKEIGLGIAYLLQQEQLSKELLDYHFATVSSSDPVFDSVSSGANLEQILSGGNITEIQMTTDLQQQQISLKLWEKEENKNLKQNMLAYKVWGEITNIMQLNSNIDFGNPKLFEQSQLEIIDGLGVSAHILVSNLQTCEAIVHIIDHVMLPQF